MNAKNLIVRSLLTMAIASVATVGHADVPRNAPLNGPLNVPLNASPAKMTPEMLKQASRALPSTSGLSYQLHAAEETRRLPIAPPADSRQLPHGCAQKSAALCYDYRAGHAVYKPMQSLLPSIPGMTPDNLSLRRNKIVARYSFK